MTTSSARASRDAAGRPEPDPVAELALKAFGVSYLYPVQRYVISNTLEGRPQVVVLPTGAGKSLCFQLPSLLLPGPTLVLVPLLSLLSDQLRKLRSAGAPVGALRGGLPRDERQRLFESIRRGEVRLLLATPEACLAQPTTGELRLCGFSHLVVDEAHCVSEWGESFRPAYLEVGTLAARLGVSMITAFTATASEEVLGKIRRVLFPSGGESLVAGGADRPNIFYGVVPVLSRWHALHEAVRRAARPALVFCRTRDGAEAGARLMRMRFPGQPVFFYHAGLRRDERDALETWFLSSTDGVLFATSAYGLGVDKPDIRTVVHADVPPSVEAYLQETGRAGRDGLPSTALLVRSREDLTFGARLADETSRRRYERILGYALGQGGCRRRTLLSLIGQNLAACAGCDVCGGTAVDRREGEDEILRFVSRHPRRFTPFETAGILCAARGPEAVRGFHDKLAGWGSLSGWERDDAEEAVRCLVAEGGLRVFASWPWAGRLTTRGPSPQFPGAPGAAPPRAGLPPRPWSRAEPQGPREAVPGPAPGFSRRP
jgi:ATP-dependent DNA helicase RecQ